MMPSVPLQPSETGSAAEFPGAVAELRQHMAGLNETAQQKILGDNARLFLNLSA